MENRGIPNIERIHHVRQCADSTIYDVLAIEINGLFGNTSIGYLTDGILVIAFNGAYMFRKNTYLAPEYLQEKLKIWSTTDATNIKNILVDLGLVK